MGSARMSTGRRRCRAAYRRLPTRAASRTVPSHRMERSLRNRLTFGPIMLAGLFLLLWLDHWIQTRTTGIYAYRNLGVAGVGLLTLMLIVLPSATMELARLFAVDNVGIRP